MIRLTGLWKGQTKDGKPKLSGTLGGARVIILLNDYKREDAQPDYHLCLAEKERPAESKAADSGPDTSIPF